jgi:hypothetical protein
MIRVMALVLAAALAGPANATAVGDEVPALTLQDAAGATLVLDGAVRRIYASSDRASGELLKTALAQDGKSVLARQGAIVVADISAAPGFVKGIIRSGLRKRGYSTWLDEGGAMSRWLAPRPEQVSIIELSQLRITAIRHVGTVDALRGELAIPPAPAAK